MRKNFFGGLPGAALVFAIVLAGCEYNGPSVNKIADTVMGRLELDSYSASMKDLADYGKLTVVKDIQKWKQTDAAYTLEVNTAEHESFKLPYFNTITWEDDGDADIKRSDFIVTLARKSDGKTAVLSFTFTNAANPKKTIKGSLTVTTVYTSLEGVETLNEFFEKALSYGLSDNANLTTGKPVSLWGQTDAAYTITAENSVDVYFPSSKVPVLYDVGNSKWEKALIEWKPPAVDSGLTYKILPGGYFSLPIGDIFYTYESGSDDEERRLELSTDSATEKQAVLNFRVTRGDQSISGTVTVKIRKAEPTPPTQEELEQEALQNLRIGFDEIFKVSGNYVLTRYIDKDITAFGQTDVSYLITIKGGSDQNDGENSYTPLNLRKTGLDSMNNVAWTTKTANYAAVLVTADDPLIKIYDGMTGTAAFDFTYTYSAGKTVKGTVTVAVVE